LALTHTDVAAILEQLHNMSMDEFTIEVGEVRIHASRSGFTTAAPTGVLTGGPSDRPPTATKSADSKSATLPELDIPDGHALITAPMVGTFYRRPSPDTDPFVEVGSHIEKGAPVAIVEVMKLFTTLYAPVTGKVTHICAEDAVLVEYGQPLIAINPD
tara:strand:+ start:1201 stop:1674 length:474 start_codon:yes stop_codon:yes gene_type:complete